MRRFSYKALDNANKIIEDEIEANDILTVKKVLKEKKLKLLKIEELSSGFSKPNFKNSNIFKKNKNKFFFGKIKTKELLIFCKLTSVLLEAGVPVLKAIDTINKQIKDKKFKIILKSLQNDLKDGVDLSNAFSKFPNQFSKIFINVIKTGEESGTLEKSFSKLAIHFEKIDGIKKNIRKAVMYPMVILIVAFFLISGLMIFVVPMFVKMFQNAKVKLPFLTKIILITSNMIKENGLKILIIIIALIISHKFVNKTKSGKNFFDNILLKIPVLKNVVIKLEIARFSRTMNSLLNSGVTIVRAFEITEEGINNTKIRSIFAKTREGIKEGILINKMLLKYKEIPRIMIQMIEVGEESGKLPEMFEKVAEFNERDLENSIEIFISLLEPIFIVLLGCVIGLIILGIYLPMANLSNIVG